MKRKGCRIFVGVLGTLLLLILYSFAGTDDHMDTSLTAKQRARIVAAWGE